jgi:hypothetical protein
MSKRVLAGTLPRKPRKRRKNGVSMRSELLEPTEATPSGAPPMRVWCTNAEDPLTTRKSRVQVPRKPRSPEIGVVAGDVEFITIESASNPDPARPKRKKKNDSVSRDRELEGI